MEQQEIVNILQHCIDDLRLTIDSLEPTHQDILTLLGNFRYRIEPRLKMMGIQLKWGVSDVPDVNYLNPRTSLQFLRIIQEAFANIVKHSKCKEIGLKVNCVGNHIEVRIEDDGVGCAELGGSNGKGLKNMSRRAAQTGFTLTAGNRKTNQGFEVVIQLPVTQ
jgi:signal transduction histidine kinase